MQNFCIALFCALRGEVAELEGNCRGISEKQGRGEGEHTPCSAAMRGGRDREVGPPLEKDKKNLRHKYQRLSIYLVYLRGVERKTARIVEKRCFIG